MKLMRTGWMGVAQAMVVGVACFYGMVGVAQDDPTRNGTVGSTDSKPVNATPTEVPGVEIQINVLASEDSDDEKDDYICVTNAPGLPQTRCRAKLVESFTTEVIVDLKNDGVGQVRFPEEANDTKTITLDRNGTTWTEFYISGKTKSDQKDDAKITAYKTGSTTAKLGQQDLTVLKVEIKRDVAGGEVDYQSLTDATRKVLPGERMNLKVEVTPACVLVSTRTWTLPGVVFKDYTKPLDVQQPASLTSVTDLNGETLQFYWADTGTDRKVAATVTAEGASIMIEEPFLVQKPVVDFAPTFQDKPQVIRFQHPTLGTFWTLVGLIRLSGVADKPLLLGATFKGTVTMPVGYSGAEGQWAYLQLATPNRFVTRNGAGKKFVLNGQRCSDWMGGPWATGANSQTKNDAPNQQVTSKFPASMSKARIEKEKYETYVMFIPPGEESRYVPLKVVNWTQAIGATLVNEETDTWTEEDGAVKTVDGPNETSTHPVWNKNVKDVPNDYDELWIDP